eukprot:CFRG5770T1
MTTMTCGTTTRSTARDSTAPDSFDEDSCSICFDEISDENSCFVEACCHNFCLTCILRWSKHVKRTCPLCQTRVTHVLSYYELDGTFVQDLVLNSIESMVQIRWLELGLDEADERLESARKINDQRIFVEEDLYGTYEWDAYDEEFDMNNFAPSHGKSGRRRKSEAGCVSVQPSRYNRPRWPSESSAEPTRNRMISTLSTSKGSPTSNSTRYTNGNSNSSARGASAMPVKLGRRAKRSLQRKIADAAVL